MSIEDVGMAAAEFLLSALLDHSQLSSSDSHRRPKTPQFTWYVCFIDTRAIDSFSSIVKTQYPSDDNAFRNSHSFPSTLCLRAWVVIDDRLFSFSEFLGKQRNQCI